MRHYDTDLIYYLLEDEKVRELHGFESFEEVTHMGDHLLDYRNYMLGNLNRDCVILFLDKDDGQYEAHTFSKTGTSFSDIRKHCVESLNYMFTKTGAHRIISLAPATNRGAVALMKACKFRFLSTRPDGWKGTTPLHAYCLDIDTWARTCYPARNRGSSFHEELEQIKPHDDLHEDDPDHNSFVGAALLMAENGLIEKGVFFYNRWCKTSRYHPASIVSGPPYLIFTGDAYVQVDKGKAKVVKCPEV